MTNAQHDTDKMREEQTYHQVGKLPEDSQHEAIIRHYASLAGLARQGLVVVDARRFGEKATEIDASIRYIAEILKERHLADFGIALDWQSCAAQSAAQSAATIARLEKEVERLVAAHTAEEQNVQSAYQCAASAQADNERNKA